MSRCLDDFLHEGFLLLKVGLEFEDSLVTACRGIRLALVFAFSAQLCLVQPPLLKDSLYSFSLVSVFSDWVIDGENHGLNNFLPVVHIPPIMHASLLPAWLHIHA